MEPPVNSSLKFSGGGHHCQAYMLFIEMVVLTHPTFKVARVGKGKGGSG